MLEKTKKYGTPAVLALAGFLAGTLVGCNNVPVRAAGEALNLSYAEIRPAAERDIQRRVTDGELPQNEADFIRQTLDEHQETINALRNFGSNQ